MRNRLEAPLVTLPEGKQPPATISAPAAGLPLQQRLTAGTTAHAISMSRRNAVEAMNGMLKEGFTSIGNGHSRVFGTVKNAFLVAFTLVGLNVYLARSFRRKIEDMKRRLPGIRRRTKRRTGTYADLLPPKVPLGRAPP
jgi:hypothetical protein